MQDDVARKSWDVRKALLSHTPMSSDAGKRLNGELKDIKSEFDRILRFVSGEKRKTRSDQPVESSYQVILEPGESMSDLLTGLDPKKVKRGK